MDISNLNPTIGFHLGTKTNASLKIRLVLVVFLSKKEAGANLNGLFVRTEKQLNFINYFSLVTIKE